METENLSYEILSGVGGLLTTLCSDDETTCFSRVLILVLISLSGCAYSTSLKLFEIAGVEHRVDDQIVPTSRFAIPHWKEASTVRISQACTEI